MKALNEICTYLDQLLQVDLFRDDYAPNGLQVEGRHQVKKMAFAVSASLNVIKEAEKWGADALFVHHGIFWNRDPYPIIGTKKEKISLLLKNNLSLIAYHLPLDAHVSLGNNWKAALDLGWRDLEAFNKIGVKGVFDEMTREAFQAKIEHYYGHKAHVALGGKTHIRSAALVSGGAHRDTPMAARAGVDCYITGSFDEPVWHQAFEETINFFALGHSASERVGPLAMMDHLSEKFGLETLFIDESNPF